MLSFHSPSEGCHILGVGDLRGRKGIKLPYPGAKAVEVYRPGPIPHIHGPSSKQDTRIAGRSARRRNCAL